MGLLCFHSIRQWFSSHHIVCISWEDTWGCLVLLLFNRPFLKYLFGFWFRAFSLSTHFIEEFSDFIVIWCDSSSSNQDALVHQSFTVAIEPRMLYLLFTITKHNFSTLIWPFSWLYSSILVWKSDLVSGNLNFHTSNSGIESTYSGNSKSYFSCYKRMVTVYVHPS